MTRERWNLLLVIAVLGLPASAAAQDVMSFDEPDTGGDTGGLAGLLGPAPTAGESLIQPEAAPAALPEPEIWAVQQAHVLRDGRFELTPYYGISLNDPFVTHNAFGLSLGWYITEVLGLSASFQWYQGLEVESRDNFHIARSFRVVVPINEYQWGFNLHFSYVPIYAKLTIFNKWIFHWDTFIVGGVGGLFTRPIPVVDPEARTFDYGLRVTANIGIGGRIFVTKFVAVFIELMDYIYMEKIESLRTTFDVEDPRPMPDDPARWGRSRFNPDNWLGESRITNNVMLQAGVSIFFPFTFEYRYPK